MEIKKYKIQVEGHPTYGEVVDLPQISSIMTFTKDFDDAIVCTYKELEAETNTPIDCIEDFVTWLCSSIEEKVVVSYEVIGVYEES